MLKAQVSIGVLCACFHAVLHVDGVRRRGSSSPAKRQGPPREILAAASQIFVWPSRTCLHTSLAHGVTVTMGETKEKQATNGHKRHLLGADPFALKSANDRPSKKAKLLDDSDDSDADEARGTLKVNKEYANRFEYNKKREEKHRRTELSTLYCILLTFGSGREVRQGQSAPKLCR